MRGKKPDGLSRVLMNTLYSQPLASGSLISAALVPGNRNTFWPPRYLQACGAHTFTQAHMYVKEIHLKKTNTHFVILKKKKGKNRFAPYPVWRSLT